MSRKALWTSLRRHYGMKDSLLSTRVRRPCICYQHYPYCLRRYVEPFAGYCRRELPLVRRVRGLQAAHLPLRSAIAQGDRSSWCACRRNQRCPRKPRYVVFSAVRKATWLTSGCSRDVQGAHAGSVRPARRQEVTRRCERDVEGLGLSERHHARVLGDGRARNPGIRGVSPHRDWTRMDPVHTYLSLPVSTPVSVHLLHFSYCANVSRSLRVLEG